MALSTSTGTLGIRASTNFGDTIQSRIHIDQQGGSSLKWFWTKCHEQSCPHLFEDTCFHCLSIRSSSRVPKLLVPGVAYAWDYQKSYQIPFTLQSTILIMSVVQSPQKTFQWSRLLMLAMLVKVMWLLFIYLISKEGEHFFQGYFVCSYIFCEVSLHIFAHFYCFFSYFKFNLFSKYLWTLLFWRQIEDQICVLWISHPQFWFTCRLKWSCWDMVLECLTAFKNPYFSTFLHLQCSHSTVLFEYFRYVVRFCHSGWSETPVFPSMHNLYHFHSVVNPSCCTCMTNKTQPKILVEC